MNRCIVLLALGLLGCAPFETRCQFPPPGVEGSMLDRNPIARGEGCATRGSR